jgi:DNA-binding NarL/FixJ family response regulator
VLRAEGMRTAGVASRVDEARSLVARRRYDVALMDVQLDEDSSIALAEELLRVDPTAAVVFFTGYTGFDSGLEEAVRVGARGFVLNRPQTRAQRDEQARSQNARASRGTDGARSQDVRSDSSRVDGG